MIRTLGKVIAVSALAMCLIFAASYASEPPQKRVTLAVLPCTDVVTTFKQFQPLVVYLKQKSGLDIQLIVPRNFAEFEKTIKEGKTDFAFQEPHTYIGLAHLYHKDALIKALTPEGNTTHHGLIIARKDSKITKVEYLKRKTVMFGSKLSAAKWMAAKWLFEKRGLNIDKDLGGYSHGESCEDIALNVYLKAYDAGAVCDYSFEELAKKEGETGIKAGQLGVIGRTELVPTWVFSARKDVPHEVVAKVNQALLKLDRNNSQHRRILEGCELGGFVKSSDEDYDGLRKLMGRKPAR